MEDAFNDFENKPEVPDSIQPEIAPLEVTPPVPKLKKRRGK